MRRLLQAVKAWLERHLALILVAYFIGVSIAAAFSDDYEAFIYRWTLYPFVYLGLLALFGLPILILLAWLLRIG